MAGPFMKVHDNPHSTKVYPGPLPGREYLGRDLDAEFHFRMDATEHQK